MNVDFPVVRGYGPDGLQRPLGGFPDREPSAGKAGEPAAFSMVAFTVDGEPVTSYGGVRVSPTGRAREDGLVIVPGVIDVRSALDDVELMAVIAASSGRTVASVCTGAFLLGHTGLLAGREWTTHWEDVDALDLPGGQTARVVDSGDVVTGGGIACGIDVGPHLVGRFAGDELARRVARQMDYIQPG